MVLNLLEVWLPDKQTPMSTFPGSPLAPPKSVPSMGDAEQPPIPPSTDAMGLGVEILNIFVHDLVGRLANARNASSLISRMAKSSSIDRKKLSTLADDLEMLLAEAMRTVDSARNLRMLGVKASRKEDISFQKIGQVIGDAARRAGRQTDIRLRQDGELNGTVRCNRNALETCVMNLIDNAIRYRLPNTMVTIETHYWKSKAEIVIHNHSSRDCSDNIQQHRTVRLGSHAGFGLLVCKKICEMNDFLLRHQVTNIDDRSAVVKTTLLVGGERDE